MALLNLENIAVLAISKEVVQGIGHESPQGIIRLVFAQIISKITGSEVTPFAVITDESTGVKYPLADYEMLPKMAIVDADMMMNAPRGLTAASGINAVTHALEAYASIMATDYTDGLALRSLKLIFENLPAAYEQGAKAPRARENMANHHGRVWPSPMPSLAYATPWPTSWALSTICPTALQMPC